MPDDIRTVKEKPPGRAALRETGLAPDRFPPALPWTVAEALAFDPPEPAKRR